MSTSPKTANTTQMAEQVLDQVMRAGATGDLIIDEGETLSRSEERRVGKEC